MDAELELDKRDRRIDEMRSFCNLLVLATHAYPFMYATSHGVEFWACTFFSRHFAIIILPVLFFLSGYCMFLKTDGLAITGEGYYRKIKSRIRRLLFPYFAWNIVFLLVYLPLGMISHGVRQNLSDWGCLSFIGCIQRLLVINDTVIDGPMWFVRCLFVLCLGYPLLHWLYRSVHWAVIVVMSLVVAIGGDCIFPKYYPAYAFAAFTIGGCASYHKIDMFEFVKKYHGLFWPISMIALLGGFVYNIYYDSFAEPASGVKFLTIPMFYLIFDWISKLMKINFVSNLILPLSFSLYSSHIFFTTVFMHLFGLSLPHVPGSMVAVTVLTLIFTILSVIGLCRIGNIIAPRLFLMLNGMW